MWKYHKITYDRIDEIRVLHKTLRSTMDRERGFTAKCEEPPSWLSLNIYSNIIIVTMNCEISKSIATEYESSADSSSDSEYNCCRDTF